MSIVKETIEELKKRSSLLWLYYGTIILFGILFIYDVFTGRDPGTTIIGIIGLFWSPTNDPVLNFLIDAVLVVLAGIGILIVGFCLLLPLLLSVMFLSWLASISVTGAILSASIIVVGIVFLIVKLLMKSSRR